ncbi:MAG: hypothetical protein WA211_09645 [Candidatus Acidiferrales bacterium]
MQPDNTSAAPVKSRLTRPLFNCSPRIAKNLTASSILTIVPLITSPTLATLAWHVRHGHTIECRGKPVYVPMRWIAEIDGRNNATLTKFPLVLPLQPGGTVLERSITIGQYLPARNRNVNDQYKTFEGWFWNLHSELRQAISGPIRMGSGSEEAFCMEGSDPATIRITASCLVLGGTWTADFIGNKPDVEDFFTIVRRLN